MKFRFVLALLALVVCSNLLEAQEKYRLSFKLENNNFFKNNEYFNEIVEGYTLVGYNAAPQLVLELDNSLEVYSGAYLLRYSGDEGMQASEFFMGAKYRPSEHFSVQIGKLNTSRFNKLADPIYSIENQLNFNYQNGFQLQFDFEKYSSDMWLTWEQFLYFGEPIQEHLYVGMYHELTLAKGTNYEFSLPLQAIVIHKGGQINSIDTSLQTMANIDVGAKLSYVFNTDKNFAYTAYPQYISYSDNSSNHQYVFDKGSAVYLQNRITYKNFEFGLDYFTAEKFIAPKGNYIFNCISKTNPTYWEENRELVIPSFSYEKRIGKSSAFRAEFSGYYDTNEKLFDYYYGLYINVNFDALILEK